RKRAAKSRARTPAPLKGLIFGPSGTAMTPSHTRRNGKLYRYYVSMDVLKRGAAPDPVSRIAAGDVERAVIDQLRGILRTPGIVVRTWRKARSKIDNITEARVRATTIDSFCVELLEPYANRLGLPSPLRRHIGFGTGRLAFDSLAPAAVGLLKRCPSI